MIEEGPSAPLSASRTTPARRSNSSRCAGSRSSVTLLADEDHAVADAYGVWVEKSFAGKKYMGVERSTFVIDADGNLARAMRRVKPDTPVDEVLAALPQQ